MIRRTFLFFLLMSLSFTSLQAQKRAFTIEDLYRVKNISDLHVAPDGKTVIFVVTTSDLARAKRNSHIWALDINGDTDGKNLRQLTTSDKSESSPTFSPDGKQILFVSSKDGSANFYLMSATDKGVWRRLTNISTSVSDPLWSPDGKWIAFSSDVYPECNDDDACNKKIAERWEAGPLKAHMADELLYRHWTSWKDGTRTHTFIVNALKATLRVCVVRPARDMASLARSCATPPGRYPGRTSRTRPRGGSAGDSERPSGSSSRRPRRRSSPPLGTAPTSSRCRPPATMRRGSTTCPSWSSFSITAPGTR